MDLEAGFATIEASIDSQGKRGPTKTWKSRSMELSTRLQAALAQRRPDVFGDEAFAFPSQTQPCWTAARRVRHSLQPAPYEDRTNKLGSGTASGYGRYVKFLSGGPWRGKSLCPEPESLEEIRANPTDPLSSRLANPGLILYMHLGIAERPPLGPQRDLT